MYRYGDGTPFPLDENFIDTLTAAVEACTSAFMPLTELDSRRERARAARGEADREIGSLNELEKALNGGLATFLTPAKRQNVAQQVAQKIVAAAKTAVQQARQQIDGRVTALEASSSARTAADAVLAALRAFFDNHQLPKAEWIMSWDTRGAEPHADAVATSGRLAVSFTLAVEAWRQPVRVDQLSDAVIVHMMKKGLLGKAKPAPIDLGKYVMVAFERGREEQVITVKERADRASPGLRFAISKDSATWQAMTTSGDAETEPNPLDIEDVDGVRRLAERANMTFGELITRRTMVDLSLAGQALAELPEPRAVPMEVLTQLTPLARTIRERSRMSGELVLKRDVGGGRREELFVPRAQLAQHFAKLPDEYRHPFEEMGITSEDTQPAIVLPRPPAKPSSPPGPPPVPDDAPTKVGPKS
jgi:hypothetical protein